MGSLVADSGGLDVSEGTRESFEGSSCFVGRRELDAGQMPLERWEDFNILGVGKDGLGLLLSDRGLSSDDEGV